MFVSSSTYYQDRIVDHFKSDGAKHIRKTYGEVTFPNFVKMVLNESASGCPTMNSCNLNIHWRPFITRCGYCDVPYDVIATAETMGLDQKYIGHLANVS